MFYECSSLTNINLSNFNTQNVTNMSWMFGGCSSLTNINLSNFNTQNVTNMSLMFGGCSSLKKENIITKDNKIINQFKKDNY
jgi:surface protein